MVNAANTGILLQNVNDGFVLFLFTEYSSNVRACRPEIFPGFCQQPCFPLLGTAVNRAMVKTSDLGRMLVLN